VFPDDTVTSAPPIAQGVSFESLTKNMIEMKAEIASLKKDLQESKIQYAALLNSQYNRLLFLIIVFVVGFTATSKIFGRVGGYLIDRKFQRSRDSFNTRVLKANKEILADVDAIEVRLFDLFEKINDVEVWAIATSAGIEPIVIEPDEGILSRIWRFFRRSKK